MFSVNTLFAIELDLTHEEKDWLRNHKNIQLATSTNFPPFAFTDHKGNIVGMQSDYFKLVSDLIGQEIGFHGYGMTNLDDAHIEDDKNIYG